MRPQEYAGLVPRPHVIVNAAVSLDGRIAAAGHRTLLLSDAVDQRRVHVLRAASDAILVGVGTVRADDPLLTVNQEFVPGGRNPLRVVLDPRGETPPSARLLKGAAATRIYHGEGNPPPEGKDVVSIAMPLDSVGRLHVPAVLDDLGRAGVKRLLVEGGGRVIASFLAAAAVDEMYLFVAAVMVGEDAPSVFGAPARGGGPLEGFRLAVVEARESGVLLRLEPR